MPKKKIPRRLTTDYSPQRFDSQSPQIRTLPSYELYAELVKFVFENGADSLVRALEEGREDVFKELVRVGINVNATYNDKNLLCVATALGRTDLVEVLLNGKADPTRFSPDGFSPLYHAADLGKLDIVEILIEANAPIDSQNKNENGNTPLIVAASLGNFAVVDRLIDAKADVNFCNPHKISPAFFAAQGNHPKVLLRLIQSGADVNLANSNNTTPMYVAAHVGAGECVSLLLNAGGCVSTQRKNGNTPIIAAAENGKACVLDQLFRAGGDPHVKNLEGLTALHHAALRGNDDAILFLVETAKASLDVVDNKGNTPIDYTRMGSSTHSLLRRFSAKNFNEIPTEMDQMD